MWSQDRVLFLELTGSNSKIKEPTENNNRNTVPVSEKPMLALSTICRFKMVDKKGVEPYLPRSCLPY